MNNLDKNDLEYIKKRINGTSRKFRTGKRFGYLWYKR